MSNRTGTTRKVLKAMGIFGSVQVIGIICSVVRTKLVAMWIGPVGMGLFGLFNAALEMINTATNLGMRNSAVPDISQALNSSRTEVVARIIAVVRRWSVWLGLAGALLTMALAPQLSRWTFETEAYMWHFVAMSAAVLFMALTNGEQAVLQGSEQLRRLAHAGLWGTLLGLVVSIPLFYWIRERSIVPSIIAYAAANALMTYVFRDRTYPKARVSARETAATGAGFIRLGMYMTVGAFATFLMNYIFSAWLNTHADTEQVGYYQAGNMLINKYTGLVLTALGMEFFPRLARVAQKRSRLRVFVSQEINVVMMVMTPVIAGFILLRRLIVWLLYSPDFYVIEEMITWGMVGMVGRGLSWCMAFVILARGDGRTYVITETLSAVLGLALNIVCYLHWGLTGLGIAFAAWYAAYVVIVAVVYFGRYRLTLSRGSLGSIAMAVVTSLAMMLLMNANQLPIAVVVFVITLTISGLYLYRSWRR